jgi:hypothetical protein
VTTFERRDEILKSLLVFESVCSRMFMLAELIGVASGSVVLMGVVMGVPVASRVRILPLESGNGEAGGISTYLLFALGLSGIWSSFESCTRQ